jgi:hypothetical protein
MLGQEIKTLVNGFREAGNYTVDFSADKSYSAEFTYTKLKQVVFHR